MPIKPLSVKSFSAKLSLETTEFLDSSLIITIMSSSSILALGLPPRRSEILIWDCSLEPVLLRLGYEILQIFFALRWFLNLSFMKFKYDYNFSEEMCFELLRIFYGFYFFVVIIFFLQNKQKS